MLSEGGAGTIKGSSTSIGATISVTGRGAFFSALTEFTAAIGEGSGCSSLAVVLSSLDVLPLWTGTVFFVEVGTTDFLVFLVLGSGADFSTNMAVASETLEMTPCALPMELMRKKKSRYIHQWIL